MEAVPEGGSTSTALRGSPILVRGYDRMVSVGPNNTQQKYVS